MSDTIQVVMWALGQPCPLRQGPDWEKPATALNTLADCRTYSGLRKHEGRGVGVFDDVCVFAATAARPGEGEGPYYHYPAGGFVLSSQFSAMGGLPSLHRLCGDCPANGDAGGLAGCVGSFHQSLYSKELQEQLERWIDRLGIAPKLDSLFPPAQLHWFRFWIRSPVSFDGAAVLHQLFEAIAEEGRQQRKKSWQPDSEKDAELDAFVRSLNRSVTAKIPLHVNLTPPGHTDLGWHTIFSHCPRCKAEAPVQRWKRKYRDEEIPCSICGASYSPAKTYSAVRDHGDGPDLREQLGQVEFEKFAARYLVGQGASETEAMHIVQKYEDRERARREERVRQTEIGRRHKRFVEQVIYEGLNNLGSVPGETPWLFSLADLEIILRRSESRGGKVHHLSHVSESGDRDESVRVISFESATQALQDLRDMGCNEKFSAFVNFPTEVVDQWEKQLPPESRNP